MITTTPSRRRALERPVGTRGFSLVEVMIGAGISVAVLAGVLSTFLFLGRSGANVANYAEMETEARRGLELFAEDTRQASDLTWNSANEVRLVVNSAAVLYGYDSANQTFYRTTNGATRILIHGVDAFNFKGYMITGAAVDLSNLTQAGRSTKQLQISLRASRTSRTVTTATNTVLSARFILRNKRITT